MASHSKMDLAFLVNKMYNCMLCKRQFDRKYDLKRHLLTTHGSSKSCVLCKRTLKSGQRKDMKVRHLTSGCPRFQGVFTLTCNPKTTKILQFAKRVANSYFV
eukprot:NODE_29_length_33183_cov_0.333666.p30 type:complete len:102 gc:universal NODE_29_length_33183_cov_0.333666:7679-7374(-)